MRGLTGHRWDGTAFRRDDAPHQYGAVHFHADDFDDSRWDSDFAFEVPESLRSGYFAAHLAGAGEHDYVPFFVSPPRGVRTADIAFLAPTATYLAYANERLLTSAGEADFSGMTNIPITLDPLDELLGEHREYGGSIYDVHTDGSGISYSSSRRPIVSMRATHRHWVTGCPRGYAFDLYAIDWLEQQGFAYDVFTDEDLHFQGRDRLAGYKVVITGSHPEYWSRPMLDALEAYVGAGGRLMNLGGNGFYWVTAWDPEKPYVIEVRRGIASSRTWNSHPGEQELASTGEHCGIWRHRGRPPNRLAGVGFAGQGWDLDTPGYRRLPDSHDPRAAFVFDGIADDEEIGEFGLVMNGAAGDELDRADHDLGTPSHALVLATSAGLHSDYYLVCHEDLLVTQSTIHGTDNPNLRADMVYFETPNDGAVFSVGSINWLGSLSHNGYDNNVSRITENVLREFTREVPS
jgi:N,N-dimethylformamidase